MSIHNIPSYLRLLCFVVVANCIYLTANAVTHGIGIKGGVNYTSLQGSSASNADMQFGYLVGVNDKIRFSNKIAIQPEFYLSTKGGQLTYDDKFSKGKASFNLVYFELPILFVYNFSNKINLHAGPYVSLLASGNIRNEAAINLNDESQNIHTLKYNPFDAGAMAGLGLDFKTISIGARYSYGFMQVGNTHRYLNNNYQFPDANNTTINLYVSYTVQ